MELPAPCSSSLLPALDSKAELCVTTAQTAQADHTAGFTPHTEDTSRLLEPGRDFARGTKGHRQAGGQFLLSANLPGTQGRGRAASLDENHIYFTDTELHWWLILHTLGTHSSSARLLEQNSHRETCFFRRANQLAGRGSTQPGSCCRAAPTPVKDRNIK